MSKSRVYRLRQRIQALEEQLLREKVPQEWIFERTEDGDWRPLPGCNPAPLPVALFSAKPLPPELLVERPMRMIGKNTR